MQQISLPFRIAIAAALVFGVAWTFVLKPKDTPAPATSAAPAAPVAPGVGGLTKSVGAAKAAVNKAEASSKTREDAANAVDPSTAPATQSGSAATPAKAPEPAAKPAPGSLESYVAGAGPAKSLVQALADGTVVVMVFKNRSSDSAAVVRSAEKVTARSRRKIRLRVTNIGNVGKYAVFTEKTPIGQAPTTLIIGPKKTARVIVGYTTTGEIRDAVNSVRRHAAAK